MYNKKLIEPNLNMQEETNQDQELENISFKELRKFKKKNYHKEKKKERQAKYKANPASQQCNFTQWNNPIFKVLKQIHPDMSIDKESKVYISHMINAFQRKVIELAIEEKARQGAELLDASHIAYATTEILAGDLAQYGLTEAQKAITKFHGNVKRKY